MCHNVHTLFGCQLREGKEIDLLKSKNYLINKMGTCMALKDGLLEKNGFGGKVSHSLKSGLWDINPPLPIYNFSRILFKISATKGFASKVDSATKVAGLHLK